MPRISRKFRNPDENIHSHTHIYKTALYTRLSYEDMRKKISDSIGTQKALLMDYLKTQPDMRLYNTYEDVNYTGTNFNRPAFTQMIEDIQAGLVDCVVVKDLSRFGRSFEETGHYLERVFPFLQIRFVAVNDNFDSLTATLDENFLMVPLKNLVNEIYSHDISKKVRSGLKAKQQRGEFCGAFASYGYIKEGSRLIVDEEASIVVKQIFEWRLEGMGVQSIVQKLNGLKITPPSKYRFEKGISKYEKHEKVCFWYASAVKRILSNPLYTGNMVQGRYKSSLLRGRSVTKTNENDWIIIENTHPQVISFEDFEAVRQINETRKNKFVGVPVRYAENILRGILVCGDCGKHMAREARYENPTFACYLNKSVSSQSCSRKTISERELHTALHTYLKCETDLATNMKRIIADLQKHESYKLHNSAIDKQISVLKKKLRQNGKFRSSLREDFNDGVITEQDYIAMKADYDDERYKLQQSLDILVAEKTKQEKVVSPENKRLSAFQSFDVEQKLSVGMVSALVEQIKVYDGARIEVCLRYRDEFENLRGHIGKFDEMVVVADE